ncbi:hypothetical protein L1887_61755 [Cichorium endivia]|nr:hypothetical protein L1887_61755 [Cichorium endivia]
MHLHPPLPCPVFASCSPTAVVTSALQAPSLSSPCQRFGRCPERFEASHRDASVWELVSLISRAELADRSVASARCMCSLTVVSAFLPPRMAPEAPPKAAFSCWPPLYISSAVPARPSPVALAH